MRSKLHRYYWREIWFEKTRRFAAWAEQQGYTDFLNPRKEHRDIAERIEREVIADIRALHERSPKYRFAEDLEAIVGQIAGIHAFDVPALLFDKHQGTCVSAE